jgi:hypothetical protein
MARSNPKLSAKEIEVLRGRVLQAIAPLKPVDRSKKYVVGSSRTRAGQRLPEHYLVYFLLVELLEFPHGGREEKVAWTVPVDYEGSFASIEHRKMGLGVFSKATPEDEKVAASIVQATNRGIKAAVPFFDHLAAEAVECSRLNVKNNSAWLFARYEFLRDQFREKADETERRRREVIKAKKLFV